MAKKRDNTEPEEAVETPETAVPEEAPVDAKAETEADRRAARRAKRGPRLEEAPSVWVRFRQQSGQGAGPHTFGPFPSRNQPQRRITLQPDQWTEVDGHWGQALNQSQLAYMVEFSAKKPK